MTMSFLFQVAVMVNILLCNNLSLSLQVLPPTPRWKSPSSRQAAPAAASLATRVGTASSNGESEIPSRRSSFSSLTIGCTKSTVSSSLFASMSASSPTPNSSNEPNPEKNDGTVRSRLRQLTGFSLTAVRASVRAFLGAVYVATFTATGAWIRQSTKYVLSIFPPAVRYFFQPLLILYYAPLFILKNLTGPTRKRAAQSHEQVMDGWRAAVQKADEKVSYWPIHIDSNGKFESDGTIELEEGIAESVDVAMEEEETEGDGTSDKTSTANTSSYKP